MRLVMQDLGSKKSYLGLELALWVQNEKVTFVFLTFLVAFSPFFIEEHTWAKTNRAAGRSFSGCHLSGKTSRRK